MNPHTSPFSRVSTIVQSTVTTVLLFYIMQSAQTTFAQTASKFSPAPSSSSSFVKKTTAPVRAATSSSMQEGKVWLSLDVAEHQYNASGSEIGKEKFRSDIDIQIIDSATNRSSTARSGETVPLQARRTYYLFLSEVPQRYGMSTKIAGQQTQVLRTPKITGGEDILLERKFVINSQPLSGKFARTEPVAQGTFSRSTPLTESLFGASAPLFAVKNGMGMAANYYVIQYCSLKNQEEALQAKAYLLRSGVRDARVEVFVDKFGQAYYRIRSGSYPEIPLAKSTIENILWKNRQLLGLKQKPIIVKAGV
jgi:hypothetical protein